MNGHRQLLSGIPSECNNDWFHIRPGILSGLIWVQTICKSYQQTTLQDNIKSLTSSKTCLKRPLKEYLKLVFKTEYCLMQVKSIAECSMGSMLLHGEHSAILSTFIKLPSVFKSFVFFIFEWPLKTRFTILTFDTKGR